MCGIAGFVGNGNEKILEKMILSIRHRGPDSQGWMMKENVGFAHARLSIIDLSDAANQPFFNEDSTLGMVFNGEIYNYVELREYLSKKYGTRFRTSGDSEVLLSLFEKEGVAALSKLNGMFAFAIYDFNKKELFVARDRLGKKPLYYGIFEGNFIYASEIKSVLQHPSVKTDLNFEALSQYLTLDYVPTPSSILQGVKKLEGGQYLIFKDHQIIKKEAFWYPNFEEKKIDLNEAESTFEHLLEDATRLRMIADVPLGVFLSGGLDSSAVAYFAQKNTIKPIKTFSIGFEEKSYNEADYAEKVAKTIGSEHHTRILKGKESLDLFYEISKLIDEPFADASIIPTYFLSKFTREKVTVALGGDGSDELLAGYPTFYSEYFAKYLDTSPKSLISLMQKVSSWLPSSDKNISLDFKINQFLKGFEENKAAIHSLWLGSFTPAMKRELFSENSNKKLQNLNGLELINSIWKANPGNSDFNNILLTYYQTYLQDDILVKVDRASMYTALEVRAPFLDYRIVDFASQLPRNFKRQGANGKVLLKNVMRGKIPDDIIDRPKKGFGIPLSEWLRGDLKPLCEDLLSDEKIKKQGYFDVQYISRIKKEHFQQKANHRKLLWNLMMFQLWNDNFGKPNF